MQAKQSTKCRQSYEYKYLKEYINITFTRMCLRGLSKMESCGTPYIFKRT